MMDYVVDPLEIQGINTLEQREYARAAMSAGLLPQLVEVDSQGRFLYYPSGCSGAHQEDRLT